MSLSKTQRAVLEELVRKAEKGPSLGFPGRSEVSVRVAEEDARRWAQTWLAAPARAVLENDAGELRASELERWARWATAP